MTQTAFMSKGELRRIIEAMDMEIWKLREKYERILDENLGLLEEKRKLRTEYNAILDEVIHHQDLNLNLQEQIRRRNKEEVQVDYLKLAV